MPGVPHDVTERARPITTAQDRAPMFPQSRFCASILTMLSGGRLRDQRHGCFAALAFAFIGCASPTSGPPPPSAPSPLLARPAPDFRRPSLDGSTVETGALRGRVVVVDFFEEHCVPCRRSLPALQPLHPHTPAAVLVATPHAAQLSVPRR